MTSLERVIVAPTSLVTSAIGVCLNITDISQVSSQPVYHRRRRCRGRGRRGRRGRRRRRYHRHHHHYHQYHQPLRL